MTLKPAFCRLAAIRLPMVPSPTNPTITLSLAIPRLRSHAEIGAPHLRIGHDHVARPAQNDAPGFQNVAMVAGFQRFDHALLDQQDSQSAIPMDLTDALEDRIDHGRR